MAQFMVQRKSSGRAMGRFRFLWDWAASWGRVPLSFTRLVSLIRNSVRHGRKLTTEQKEKLKILSRDIIRHTLVSET